MMKPRKKDISQLISIAEFFIVEYLDRLKSSFSRGRNWIDALAYLNFDAGPTRI